MYPTTTTLTTLACLAAGLAGTVAAGPTPPPPPGSSGPYNFNITRGANLTAGPGAPPPGPPPSLDDTRPGDVSPPLPPRGLVHRRAATAFDASTATLDEFSANALEVAMSRIPANASRATVNSSSTCTAENVSVRKLWDNMGSAERINYTDSMLCLMDKPAKTPSELAPGAKTRYDDWIVAHINQTTYIHSTANFLGWHRWFVWSMEQALRDECGYTGALPYWDWTKTEQEGFNNSQLFDGSATSLSGNGAPLNHTDSDVIILGAGTASEVVLPHGTGGGCVTSGPFANITVNLGPDSLPVIDSTTADNSSYPFAYNPRCLRRDFTEEILHRYSNTSSVLALLRPDSAADIWAFEMAMQGPGDVPEIGVHGAGHYSTGGDPGRDVYVSPGEPAFWSHHANIDRVWWTWQMLDPETRANTSLGLGNPSIRGPLTMNDEYEPHGNGTAADLQNLGYVSEGEEVQLGELMSTTSGMFCYVYE